MSRVVGFLFFFGLGGCASGAASPPTVSPAADATQATALPRNAAPPPRPPSSGPASPLVTPRPLPGAPATFAWPSTRAELLSALHTRASSGGEPALSPVADLLAVIAAAAPTATTDVAITRLRDVEVAEKARRPAGMAWSTLAVFVEPMADATAIRGSYLDFDRVGTYTGKPGTTTVGRRGDVTIGRTDAVRKVLGFEIGARWTFHARSLDLGVARLIVCSMADAPDTAHMLVNRAVLVAIPGPDGVFVAEASSSVVDFDIPGILKGPAEAAAKKEMLARTGGIRSHWRDYVK